MRYLTPIQLRTLITALREYATKYSAEGYEKFSDESRRAMEIVMRAERYFKIHESFPASMLEITERSPQLPSAELGLPQRVRGEPGGAFGKDEANTEHVPIPNRNLESSDPTPAT